MEGGSGGGIVESNFQDFLLPHGELRGGLGKSIKPVFGMEVEFDDGRDAKGGRQRRHAARSISEDGR